MKALRRHNLSGKTTTIAVLTVLIVASASGCALWKSAWMVAQPLPLPPPPAPHGQSVDAYMQKQEEAGESQDFVVYDHEFIENSPRLTPDGEDHLRQIAARAANTPFPIIVEQSKMHASPGVNQYPVYGNSELDLRRQQVVVHALSTMGVADAPTRVVVAPALSPGFTAYEGERAYRRGMSGGGFGGGRF